MAGEANVFESHDLIDNIEQDFKREGLVMTLHLDPIVTNDPAIHDMLTEADIYALLDAHGVEHHVLHHGPVLTVEAAHEAGICATGETYGAIPCKNLFLRDDKSRHFWLVTAPDDARIDLRMRTQFTLVFSKPASRAAASPRRASSSEPVRVMRA